ncbi:hypothetical protein [Corynebacterium nuruki]|uniref:hypothetical protein n=1 Tax=Corynebacterium nuruki TaxID=1032851 RepID=UPI0039BF2CB0
MTEMKTYVKRPVPVQAVRLTDDNAADIVKMIDGPVILDNGGPGLLIDTPKGLMHATPGDYIVQGISGEFYPVKPNIFRRTYEETPND